MAKEVHNSVPPATSVVPLPPSYKAELEFQQAQILQAQRTEAIAEIVHNFLYLEGKPTPTGAIALGKSNTAVWDTARSELLLYSRGETDSSVPKMRAKYEGGCYTPLPIADTLEKLQHYGLQPQEVEHFLTQVQPLVKARLQQLQEVHHSKQQSGVQR